jgi:hypothetical protein
MKDNPTEPHNPASLDTFTLDRSFVLTQGKTLLTGSPYLYNEGSHSVAVKLTKAWIEDDIIYLTLQELQSQKSFTVSWNLEYSGSYYLWTIADLQTLLNI